jgi:hypothetical protein
MVSRRIHYAPEHRALQRQFLMRRNILWTFAEPVSQAGF